MRLDHFLASWFREFSRTALAREIKDGQVCIEGRPLRAGTRVRAGDALQIHIAGIAPSGPPPAFPHVIHASGGLVVVDKPAGMLCHPTGSRFVWALIGLARERWPNAELVHRIDRDTSGLLALTDDPQLNRTLKLAVMEGRVLKEYVAICKGEIPWDDRSLTGPIGPAGGVIRIQMAVQPDGKHARTDVTVLDRQPGLTLVRCRIHTGRTHQIRVHLSHAGFPLLGDRMYGVAPDVFLRTLDHGADRGVVEAAGAPRHALHSSRLILPLPDGPLSLSCEMPADMTGWWKDPGRLPHDEGG